MSRNGLIGQNGDVSSIESWNRQDVHDGQDDTDESRQHPKLLPIPYTWEDAPYRDERTHRLRSVGTCHVFQVVDIAAKDTPAVLQASGDAGEETVILMLRRVETERTCLDDSQHVVLVELNPGGILSSSIRAPVNDIHLAETHAVRMGATFHREDIGATKHETVKVCPRLDIRTIHSHEVVSLADTRSAHRSSRQDRIDDRRNVCGHEGWVLLKHVQKIEFLLQRDCHLLAITQNGYLLSITQGTQHAGAPLLDCLPVRCNGDVSVTESKRLSVLVELESMLDVLHGKIITSPGQHDGTIDDPCCQQVHQDTTHHDEETLPNRLRAELIRFGRLFHLLRIHALVHHTGNLDVSPQGNPSDAILRLVVLEEREKTGKPLVAGTEQMEPGIEKHIELLHTDTEEFGETKVSPLVQQHQETKAAKQLQGFYQNYIHIFSLKQKSINLSARAHLQQSYSRHHTQDNPPGKAVPHEVHAGGWPR